MFQIRRDGSYLVATIESSLADDSLAALADALVERVLAERASGVILDVGSLDVVDSFAARTLRALTARIQQSGAAIAVIGLQPDVAFSMGRHGLTFEGIPLARDLESALSRLAEARQKGL